MLSTFLSSLGSKLFILLLVTSTLLTTGIAISKVSSSLSNSQVPVKGINIVAAENNEGLVESKVSPVEALARRVTKVISTIAPTIMPTAFPMAPSPIATKVLSDQCLIILFGKQYDVTKLRSTHSGGDIFKCGTDMTATYTGRHGTDLTRMQVYLITSGSQSSPTVAPTTITPTQTQTRRDRGDDRDDYEHRDRYIESEKHYRENDD